jgi:hypothetical protein
MLNVQCSMLTFVIRYSSFIPHSGFIIRHYLRRVGLWPTRFSLFAFIYVFVIPAKAGIHLFFFSCRSCISWFTFLLSHLLTFHTFYTFLTFPTDVQLFYISSVFFSLFDVRCSMFDVRCSIIKSKILIFSSFLFSSSLPSLSSVQFILFCIFFLLFYSC